MRPAQLRHCGGTPCGSAAAQRDRTLTVCWRPAASACAALQEASTRCCGTQCPCHGQAGVPWHKQSSPQSHQRLALRHCGGIAAVGPQRRSSVLTRLCATRLPPACAHALSFESEQPSRQVSGGCTVKAAMLGSVFCCCGYWQRLPVPRRPACVGNVDCKGTQMEWSVKGTLVLAGHSI